MQKVLSNLSTPSPVYFHEWLVYSEIALETKELIMTELINRKSVIQTLRLVSGKLLELPGNDMTPVARGDAREKLLALGLSEIICFYGKEVDKKILGIDARGEMPCVVKGKYGDDMAAFISRFPRRTGISPCDGRVLPCNNWCRLNHFDVEKMIHTAADEFKIYSVRLESCGNPDHGQDPDQPVLGVPPCDSECSTIEQASEVCLSYIEEFNLGGGNWAGGQVVDEDGCDAGYVSYNGRFFPASPADPGIG